MRPLYHLNPLIAGAKPLQVALKLRIQETPNPRVNQQRRTNPTDSAHVARVAHVGCADGGGASFRRGLNGRRGQDPAADALGRLSASYETTKRRGSEGMRAIVGCADARRRIVYSGPARHGIRRTRARGPITGGVKPPGFVFTRTLEGRSAAPLRRSSMSHLGQPMRFEDSAHPTKRRSDEATKGCEAIVGCADARRRIVFSGPARHGIRGTRARGPITAGVKPPASSLTRTLEGRSAAPLRRSNMSPPGQPMRFADSAHPTNR
jgi:hypothetical protein